MRFWLVSCFHYCRRREQGLLLSILSYRTSALVPVARVAGLERFAVAPFLPITTKGIFQVATSRPLHRTNMNSNGEEASYEGDEEASTVSSASSDDDHKRIRLPVLKYGYRTEPLDWAELVDIILVQKDLAKMSRSVEQQRDYEVYKRDLLLEWSSVTDCVLCQKFATVFTQRFDAATHRYRANPPLRDIASVHTALVKNDFPYFMVPGIEHWVLWKLGGSTLCCTDADIQTAKAELRQKITSNTNSTNEDGTNEDTIPMLCWVNPPHLTSLPEIDHVHILVNVPTDPVTTTLASS